MATPIPRNAAAFTLAEVAQATSGRARLRRRLRSRFAAWSAIRARRKPATCTSRCAANATTVTHSWRKRWRAARARRWSRIARALPAAQPAWSSRHVARARRARALHRKRWGGARDRDHRFGRQDHDQGADVCRAAGCGCARRAHDSATSTTWSVRRSRCCASTRSSDTAVIEIGTSAPGEIARLAQICAPDVGVVTAVAAAHTAGPRLDRRRSRPRKHRCCGRCRRRHGDLQRGPRRAAEPARPRARADAASAFGADAAGGRATAVARARRDAGDALRRARARQGGRRSASTCSCSASVPRSMRRARSPSCWRCSAKRARSRRARLAHVAPVPGRLAPLRGPAGSLILDDSYNANPASMRRSIATALELARVRGGRALLVLGDMLELGAASRGEHEAVGRLAAQPGVAALVACGREMTAARRDRARASAAHRLASCRSRTCPIRRARRCWSRRCCAPGDVVLVKGSRGMAMERVVDGLRGRGGARDLRPLLPAAHARAGSAS